MSSISFKSIYTAIEHTVYAVSVIRTHIPLCFYTYMPTLYHYIIYLYIIFVMVILTEIHFKLRGPLGFSFVEFVQNRIHNNNGYC